MRNQREMVVKLIKEKPIYLLFVAFVVFSLAFVKGFSNGENLLNILVQSADLIIVACGLTFVIMNGGIDFSVVATINLGSIVGASIMSKDEGFLAHEPYGWIVAVLAMILIGLVIGSIRRLGGRGAENSVLYRDDGDAARFQRTGVVLYAIRNSRQSARPIQQNRAGKHIEHSYPDLARTCLRRHRVLSFAPDGFSAGAFSPSAPIIRRRSYRGIPVKKNDFFAVYPERDFCRNRRPDHDLTGGCGYAGACARNDARHRRRGDHRRNQHRRAEKGAYWARSWAVCSSSC